MTTSTTHQLTINIWLTQVHLFLTRPTKNLQRITTVPRVHPTNSRIVVTRSIGDSCASKLGVTYQPDVYTLQLEDDDEYFILASDGLWDGLSVEQAGDILKNNGLPVEQVGDILRSQTGDIPKNNTALQQTADALTAGALILLEKKQIDDNVTALVVDVRF